MKKTAVACSNLALIKYWGLQDENLRLPVNDSLSVNLDNLRTTTTVDFSSVYTVDQVEIDGQKASGRPKMRIIQHLERIRSLKGVKTRARIVSKNNFPVGTGLSSSASGFAAFTLAGITSMELQLEEKVMTSISRLASGSSCRSIPAGFVQWHKGKNHHTSFAESVFPADYWDIVDLVAVVSNRKKTVATSLAMTSADTSPFFRERLILLPEKLKMIKESIRNRDFEQFGNLVEAEAFELHAIMMTGKPSYIFLYPETIQLMTKVRSWRKSGLEVYFSLNTGHNLHLLSREVDQSKVYQLLRKEGIKDIIINRPGPATRLTDRHLF